MTDRLGVVVPAFREAATVPTLLQRILEAVPSARIVVVDDSPDDDTVQAVADLGLDAVELIHRAGKGGRGSAVVEGVRRLLDHDVSHVVEMDADLAHPPDQIPQLLDHARAGAYDLVIASRYLPSSRVENYGWHRKALSRASNLLERTLLGVPVSDYTMGYRIYSRRAAEVIGEHCARLGSGFIVLGEILVQVYYRGLRVGEVPTHFVHRIRENGSVGWSEIRDSLVALWRIAALKRALVRAHGPR